MHPDDVNARDWEFVLSDRFPSVPLVSAAGAWARSLARADDAVASARAHLVNSHGELEPLIEKLESALDGKESSVSFSEHHQDALTALVERQDAARALMGQRHKGRRPSLPTPQLHWFQPTSTLDNEG